MSLNCISVFYQQRSGNPIEAKLGLPCRGRQAARLVRTGLGLRFQVAADKLNALIGLVLLLFLGS